MNNNLKIGYSGGSGGFLLLHLLLLSGRYHTSFDSPDTVDNIIKHQWAITDHQKWKHSENWPDNTDTDSYQTDLSKLYFFCNPYEPKFSWSWNKLNTKSLILYTDLSSQLLLAEYKKANWFTSFQNWQVFYDSVKADDWPPCAEYSDVNFLPKHIQQELFDRFDAKRFIIPNTELPDNSVKFNTISVLAEMITYLESADYTITLQDLVNTNGEILVSLLDLPPINDSQRDLIKHWRSLHDPTLLKTIGILC